MKCKPNTSIRGCTHNLQLQQSLL